MKLTYFLDLSASMLLRPLRTLSKIHKRTDNKRLLFLGFIGALIGFVSGILANEVAASAIISRFSVNGLVFSVFWSFFTSVLVMAAVYFSLSLFKKGVDIVEFWGLYWLTEFPYMLLLPVALILTAIPVDLSFLFTLLSFGLWVMSVVLKIKAITLCSGLDEGRAFGAFAIPLGFFAVLFIFFFFMVFLNLSQEMLHFLSVG